MGGPYVPPPQARPDTPPPASPPAVGLQPGTSERVTLLILQETSGFSGIFGYSPSPGANNMIFSIAFPMGGTGTDPYGNIYLAGFVTYAFSSTYGLYIACQNNLGNIQFWDAPDESSGWNASTEISIDGSGNVTLSGTNLNIPSQINGVPISWSFLSSINQMSHTGNASKSGIGVLSNPPTAAQYNALNTAYNNTVDTINNGILAKLQNENYMA